MSGTLEANLYIFAILYVGMLEAITEHERLDQPLWPDFG